MTYDAGGLDQLKTRIFSSSESGNQDGTAALNQSEASPSAADHQPARICIVEDDPVMLRMVGDYLEQHNMRAIAVSGRQEMARLFAAGEPDLVVLDLRLDHDDGLDLLREMRTRSDVPVIITTGDRRDEVDRVVGLELGADDYVTKPFSLRELLARIRAVLRRHEAGRGASPRDVERGRYRFGGWQLDPAQPAAHRPQRDRGPADQRRICPADRLSRRAPAARQPRTIAASNACARRHFRSQHRCTDPAVAAQTRGRSERAANHSNRARRRLRVRAPGRAGSSLCRFNRSLSPAIAKPNGSARLGRSH